MTKQQIFWTVSCVVHMVTYYTNNCCLIEAHDCHVTKLLADVIKACELLGDGECITVIVVCRNVM